jgi:replicative DNA helicase
MDTGEQLHSAAEQALADLCRDIYDRIGADDSAALIAELSTRVRELADTAADPMPLEAAPSFIADVLADLERRMQHFEQTGSTIMGHATGLNRLDDLLGGLETGRVTILQAAPGTGKTTLSNQIAYHVAAHSGAPVLYISFENDPIDLTLKTLCRLAGVSLSQASKGLVQPVKLAEAVRLFQARAGSLYYQAGNGATTLESIRATLVTIIRAHPNAGHPVVFIDYLQQLARSATLGSREDIFSAVSRISGGLSSLANETGAHVLAISSMNRESYKNGAKASMASGKGSGDIEFDAAHVLSLNTDDKNQPPDSNTDLLHLGLVKNRYGALGAVHLGRDRTTLRIAEIDTRATDPGHDLVGRTRENGGR